MSLFDSFLDDVSHGEAAEAGKQQDGVLNPGVLRCLLLVTLLVAAGCTTEPEDDCVVGRPAVCAFVRGTVADSSGAPLAGLGVGPRYSVELCVCTTEFGRTDDDGRYSFRIARMTGIGLDESWPDSVALYVTVGEIDGWIDSVLTTVVFDPTSVDHEVNVVVVR